MRDRFISTLYTCYYIRPLEEASILRAHPAAWQIWLEQEDAYELATELSSKPMGEELDRVLLKLTAPETGEENSSSKKIKKPGVLGSLQKFLKALSQ